MATTRTATAVAVVDKEQTRLLQSTATTTTTTTAGTAAATGSIDRCKGDHEYDVVSGGGELLLLASSSAQTSSATSHTSTVSSLTEDRGTRTASSTRSSQDYEIISLLGKGALGTVSRACNRHTHEEVALKTIQKRNLNEKQRLAVLEEKKILQKLDHVNIIKLNFAFQDGVHLYFALEYASGGDLSDHLSRHGRLPLFAVRFIAAELASALSCLRQHNIVHRDIKPANLLIGRDGHVKLSDFNSATVAASGTHAAAHSELPVGHYRGGYRRQRGGTSRQTAGVISSRRGGPGTGAATGARPQHQRLLTEGNFVGTRDYLAPEAVESGTDNSVGFGADLWAFGCVLYQLLTGVPPFKDDSDRYVYKNILDIDYTIPPVVPRDARDLIQKLLQKRPDERLGFHNIHDLMNHVFFVDINWQTLATATPPDLTRIWREPAVADSGCGFDELLDFDALEFTPNLGESFKATAASEVYRPTAERPVGLTTEAVEFMMTLEELSTAAAAVERTGGMHFDGGGSHGRFRGGREQPSPTRTVNVHSAPEAESLRHSSMILDYHQGAPAGMSGMRCTDKVSPNSQVAKAGSSDRSWLPSSAGSEQLSASHQSCPSAQLAMRLVSNSKEVMETVKFKNDNEDSNIVTGAMRRYEDIHDHQDMPRRPSGRDIVAHSMRPWFLGPQSFSHMLLSAGAASGGGG